jgi:hypothetical protein
MRQANPSPEDCARAAFFALIEIKSKGLRLRGLTQNEVGRRQSLSTLIEHNIK